MDRLIQDIPEVDQNLRRKYDARSHDSLEIEVPAFQQRLCQIFSGVH
jgi:hypothetical protein